MKRLNILFNSTAVNEVIIYPICTDGENPKLSNLEGYSLPETAVKRMKVTWFYQREGEPAIVCVGLGDKNSLDAEHIRRAAGTVGRAIEQERVTKVSVDFSQIPIKLEPHFYGAWVEG